MEISEEEYENLKADKKRLDFLEECHTRLNDLYKTDYGWEVIINHNVVRLMKERDIRGIDLNDAKGGNDKIKTCRLAIDKKMEEIEFQRKALNKKLEEEPKPCPKCGSLNIEVDADGMTTSLKGIEYQCIWVECGDCEFTHDINICDYPHENRPTQLCIRQWNRIPADGGSV